MKIIDLLKKQHQDVADLFERFEGAKSLGDKRTIFEQVAAMLVAHDAIEREIYYPVCEQELGKDSDILRESLVEHGMVEFALFRADQHENRDILDQYVKVLQEMVEHHVEEEEKELLPKMEKKLGAQRSESIAASMQARFEKAIAADFRKALKANLQQVLAGRTKTRKAPAKTRTRPVAKTRVAKKTITAGRARRADARA